MPKRKASTNFSVESDTDLVPIPIQFFFWNQTSLFIKQKFGALTEAHAMNFEKVIVQNILHGLSPGLSDAISSITRWSFIKASFPHIMHACASALLYRKENTPGAKLSKTETKLLYTLHWLIIDAASECEDNAATQTVKIIGKKASISSGSVSRDFNRSFIKKKRPPSAHQQQQTTTVTTPVYEANKEIDTANKTVSYIHSVATIQLFVYLFVPLLKSLQPEDLDNLKLSNGLKIWESLWSHRQPAIKIFNTPVKQKYETKEGEQLIFVQETMTTTTTGSKLPNASTTHRKVSLDLVTKKFEISAANEPSANKELPSMKLKYKEESINKENTSFGAIYMGSAETTTNINNTITTTPTATTENQKSLENDNVAVFPPPPPIPPKSTIPKSMGYMENMSRLAEEQQQSERIRASPSQASFAATQQATDTFLLKQEAQQRIDESDSIHISDFDSDTIRDSVDKSPSKSAVLPTPVRSPTSGTITTTTTGKIAPIVHMSSICSINESPAAYSTTNTSSISTTPRACGSSLTTTDCLTIFCPRCNFILQSVRLDSVSSYVESTSTLSCKNCFGVIRINETAVKTPASTSLCMLSEFTERLAYELRNVSVATTPTTNLPPLPPPQPPIPIPAAINDMVDFRYSFLTQY